MLLVELKVALLSCAVAFALTARRVAHVLIMDKS